MKSKIFFTLLFILILGTSLRFYNLNKAPLWKDEAYTLKVIDGNIIENVKNIEGAPPLYFILIKGWNPLFGVDTMRIFSALFGIASILVLFYILKENIKVALGSSFLLSISMLNIVYSQEARFYTLSLFLMLLSTYFLKELFKDKSAYFPFVFFSLLSIYTNYIAVIVLVLQSLYVHFYKKEIFSKFIKYCLLPTTLLSLPLIPLLIVQFQRLIPLWQMKFVEYGFPAFMHSWGVFTVFGIFLLLIIFIIILFSTNSLSKISKFMPLIVIVYSVAYILLLGTITHSVFFVRYFLFMLVIFYVYASMNKHCVYALTALNCYGLYMYFM